MTPMANKSTVLPHREDPVREVGKGQGLQDSVDQKVRGTRFPGAWGLQEGRRGRGDFLPRHRRT